jgi:ribose/xylose/arabinose/galactoside ABC-type transport system permease subunit
VLLSTTLFAFVGVSIFEMILSPLFGLPVLVAIIALYVSAGLLGYIAGGLVYRFGLRSFATPLSGMALSIVCLLFATLAGTSLNFFSNISEPGSLDDYVIRPSVGIITFGSFPALILGLIYSVLMRESLTFGELDPSSRK